MNIKYIYIYIIPIILIHKHKSVIQQYSILLHTQQCQIKIHLISTLYDQQLRHTQLVEYKWFT